MLFLLIIWELVLIITLISGKHNPIKTLVTNNLHLPRLRLSRKYIDGYIVPQKIFAVLLYKIHLLFPTNKT